jgi:hypothetical protein
MRELMLRTELVSQRFRFVLRVVTSGILCLSLSHAASHEATAGEKALAIEKFRRLPLGFEWNARQAGAESYQKIKYLGVYPSIGPAHYGIEKPIEYDYVLTRGGDPANISVLLTGGGAPETGFQRLPCHQHVHLSQDCVRREGKSLFISQGNRMRFAMVPYDYGLPLVIDPTVPFTMYPGASADRGNGSDGTLVVPLVKAAVPSTIPAVPGCN